MAFKSARFVVGGGQEFPVPIGRRAECLRHLPDIQIGRDGLSSVAKRPLHDHEILALVNHQRALGVAEIVHPKARKGLLVGKLDPLQRPMPGHKDVVLGQRAAATVGEDEVSIGPR